ncbi:Plasmodium exported protein, unknown function [Plasmodium vivax]|uniref:Uncharacterized protein n=3 Tax=Plasmodium vivax TaxID=5855 RepID=A0A1G4GVR2_PLAVI|nr:Plasmodium exported protein, unknown function [Plasmodium vivax]VUZ94989.1 Plasmodium exported protein, unknown function [Plasmodium vivax]
MREGKKPTGNHLIEEDNAKWGNTNVISFKGWRNVCVGVLLLLCLFVKVPPPAAKQRRMLSMASEPERRDSNISIRELEESVKQLTEQVGYNDTSEDDEEAIISMELINRNIAACLRINKKAIRKWYEQCLSAKTRYWQIKMNFWRRFKMYTRSELFFGEKTRGVDKIWKDKMWAIWISYIHRMMWEEDVEDTIQFKKRINKCYSYMYIRDRYTQKKRHFRRVKQRKIVNAWSHFLDTYTEKWRKERKAMAMAMAIAQCTARKKQSTKSKQPAGKKQPVKKRAKVASASSLIPPGQQRLQHSDDSVGHSIGGSLGGRIGSNIGSSIGSTPVLNSLGANAKTGRKESPLTKKGAAKKGVDKNGTAITGASKTGAAKTMAVKTAQIKRTKIPPPSMTSLCAPR